MSYYSRKSDIEITKREIFVSIIFALTAICGGICIAGSIRSCENDANVKYYQAIKIADSTQFNYAFKTNAGHTFAYGVVSAVGYVTDEGIGHYMTLTRILEEYRKHYKTFCNGEGKDRHCHEETYWSWDKIGSKNFAVSQVNFLGRNFFYDYFPSLPWEGYIATIKIPQKGFFSKKQRYVYYGSNLTYTGTLYANIDNHQMNDATFLNGASIEDAINRLTHTYGVTIFWVIFSIIGIILVGLFVILPNRWLYGKFWRSKKENDSSYGYNYIKWDR